jgi:putative oxidoreductase
VTTDDDRPRPAGGYADSGRYNADTEDFGYGGQSSRTSDSSIYDDAGYSSPTTAFPGSSTYDSDDDFGGAFDEPEKRTIQWHGGADFGLLVLRLVVGGLFVVHGLDKLFGWFTDMGMGNTEELVSSFGFTEPKILAWVLAVSETAGGLLLAVGLFTPAAAAAILGVMANVLVVRADWSHFLGDVELELVFAAVAFALLFTGPGRISIDRNTHWARKPPIYGIVFLVVAAGASAVTLFVFR